MAKVLIVDDENNIIKIMSDIVQDEGHLVYNAKSGSSALEFIRKNDVDIIFLDVWLPDCNGLDILEKIQQLNNDIEVIMISGHGSIDIAVKSTKMGAYDFLEKPPSIDRIITVMRNAIEQQRLRKENRQLKKSVENDDEMIGSSEQMIEIKKIIKTAAATNARVFITGANGTGKELVARAIYRNSKRCNKPFIKINCAAIPDELIESELFGHEKGSFTGAVGRRIGKFELADTGTIFLDEICDMSQSAQAKVLRVLQEQQLERVGGNETISVDVRVIAATNVDVHKAIAEGKFREDLFYRLNVIPINIPSLAERKPDIELLSKYYIERFADEHGVGKKEFTEEGIEFLKSYTWPGNVRELKNIMERLSIMVASNEIGKDDIGKYLEINSHDESLFTDNSDLKSARDEFEKNYIINALKSNKKNISITAKELGIERTNLHRKINQYNIDVDSI